MEPLAGGWGCFNKPLVPRWMAVILASEFGRSRRPGVHCCPACCSVSTGHFFSCGVVEDRHLSTCRLVWLSLVWLKFGLVLVSVTCWSWRSRRVGVVVYTTVYAKQHHRFAV